MSEKVLLSDTPMTPFEPATTAKIAPPNPAPVATDRVVAALQRAADLAAAADSPNTVRAYRSDVAQWQAWAESAGLDVYPIGPEALAAWIGAMAAEGLAEATVRRRCAAVARLHRDQGHASPTDDGRVRRVLKGLSRAVGQKNQRRKKAITPGIVRAFMTDPQTSVRDRALLAVGFVTGMRRSELVALRWRDVDEHPDGWVITISRSKSDQAGEGAMVAVPYGTDPATCPARALAALRAEAARDDGDRVFDVCARTVARVVKRAAQIAGHDPAAFGGHSLRAGLATVAAQAGVSLAESMAATRHKSASVAASYVRPTSAMRNAAYTAAVSSLVSA